MIHLENQTILTPDDVVKLVRQLPNPAAAETPDTVVVTMEGSKSEFAFTKLKVNPEAGLSFKDAAGADVAGAGRWAWVFSGPLAFVE